MVTGRWNLQVRQSGSIPTWFARLAADAVRLLTGHYRMRVEKSCRPKASQNVGRNCLSLHRSSQLLSAKQCDDQLFLLAGRPVPPTFPVTYRREIDADLADWPYPLNPSNSEYDSGQGNRPKGRAEAQTAVSQEAQQAVLASSEKACAARRLSVGWCRGRCSAVPPIAAASCRAPRGAMSCSRIEVACGEGS